MDAPIRYTVNGDVHIAYQVVGGGTIDLVYTPGIWSNLEIMWEWPANARLQTERDRHLRTLQVELH